MLNNHIVSKILTNFSHSPTPSQLNLIEKAALFITEAQQGSVFVVTGYAGTGKTTIIKAIVETLASVNINSVLLAPTGRAAKVMSLYTNKPAFTIHKYIYRQKSASDGFGSFALDFNKHNDTYFIIDEASMISNGSTDQSVFGSGRLLDDLVEYVDSGQRCKTIIIGDVAQLPPVKLDESPALSHKVLSAYYHQVFSSNLTDVVRQQQESYILKNATLIRDRLYNNMDGYFKLDIISGGDVIPLSGADLIETLATEFDNVGIEQTIVVTPSNKRANQFNQGIRNQVLWREEEISVTDRLMVVRNNYFWIEPEKDKADFIANGDTIEIIRIRKYQELYGFRFADVTIKLTDYNDKEIDVKIMLDTLSSESPSLPYDDSVRLYNEIAKDYPEIKSKKKLWEELRKNPYFNALQVKFAYAVTCHKAQGGQWDTVFLDHGYLTEERVGKDFLRWLYTAFTRARKRLYLVNFNDDFFDKEKLDR